MKKQVNINFLKSYLEKLGMTQTDFAVIECKKSTTTISKMMNGIAPARAKTRREIAEAVGADVGYLFPDLEETIAS